MAEKILFVGGSLNQTKQMHKISKHLGEYDLYFTPYYADGIEDFFAKMGWAEMTVLSGRHRRETLVYIKEHNLQLDERGKKHDYDLVFIPSDLIIQRNLRDKRIILVQEGITEPESLMFHLVKWLKLPRYLANTSTNGLSNAYDLFCVASECYADLFIRKGVHPEKIAVTGIPNFDNLKENHKNDFPHHGDRKSVV